MVRAAAVFDGRQRLGSVIVDQCGRATAYDVNNKPLGTFHDLKEATRCAFEGEGGG
jgi:hypothetical protein